MTNITEAPRIFQIYQYANQSLVNLTFSSLRKANADSATFLQTLLSMIPQPSQPTTSRNNENRTSAQAEFLTNHLSKIWSILFEAGIEQKVSNPDLLTLPILYLRESAVRELNIKPDYVDSQIAHLALTSSPHLSKEQENKHVANLVQIFTKVPHLLQLSFDQWSQEQDPSNQALITSHMNNLIPLMPENIIEALAQNHSNNPNGQPINYN